MGKIKDIAVVTLLIEDIRMFLALSLKLLSIKWYECLCTLNSCKNRWFAGWRTVLIIGII
jgi:hypothetical protein